MSVLPAFAATRHRWTTCNRRSNPHGNNDRRYCPRMRRPRLRMRSPRRSNELDAGRLRVAEKLNGGWTTHQWLKKAVLLSFRLSDNVVIGLAGPGRSIPFLRQGSHQVRAFRRGGLRAVGRACRAPGGCAPRCLHRSQRRADAELRQHRCVRRRGDDGRHLGDRGIVRTDRQERAPLRRCRHRRGLGTAAGKPHHYRGQLLYRSALGGRRGRRGRGKLGAGDGRLSSARAPGSTIARPAK